MEDNRQSGACRQKATKQTHACILCISSYANSSAIILLPSWIIFLDMVSFSLTPRLSVLSFVLVPRLSCASLAPLLYIYRASLAPLLFLFWSRSPFFFSLLLKSCSFPLNCCSLAPLSEQLVPCIFVPFTHPFLSLRFRLVSVALLLLSVPSLSLSLSHIFRGRSQFCLLLPRGLFSLAPRPWLYCVCVLRFLSFTLPTSIE